VASAYREEGTAVAFAYGKDLYQTFASALMGSPMPPRAKYAARDLWCTTSKRDKSGEEHGQNLVIRQAGRQDQSPPEPRP